MRIVVTGGAGFIGSHLSLYLIKNNQHVIVIDNLRSGYLENLKGEKNSKLKPEFIKKDVRDPKIGEVIKGADVVFHLAGLTSLPECQNNPGETYEVNVGGTANVLETARRYNVKRVIFSSTSAVYENENSFPSKEDMQVNPTLSYGLSKKHAEEVCVSFQKLYGMDITILRFFNVYGPHMDFRRPNPPFISYIIKCLLKHKPPILHSDGNQARDMIYVDDVLTLCKILLTHKNAKNQTFNVGSGKTYSVTKVYEQVAMALGREKIKPIFRSASLLWNKYPGLFKEGYSLKTEFVEQEVNRYTLASIKKIKKLLNWSPKVNFSRGIKMTTEFAIKNYSFRS